MFTVTPLFFSSYKVLQLLSVSLKFSAIVGKVREWPTSDAL